MPSKNQTVQKINKSTLARIRRLAQDFNKSVPQTIDLIVDCYEQNHTRVPENWKKEEAK